LTKRAENKNCRFNNKNGIKPNNKSNNKNKKSKKVLIKKNNNIKKTPLFSPSCVFSLEMFP